MRNISNQNRNIYFFLNITASLFSAFWIGFEALTPDFVYATENNDISEPRDVTWNRFISLKPAKWLENKIQIRAAYDEINKDPQIKNTLSGSTKNFLNVTEQISGPTHVKTTKFQHYYNGIEVIGSMAIHHQTDTGSAIRDKLAKFDLSTTPTITQETAVSLAQGLGHYRDLKTEPYLRILPSSEEGSARLVYWVELKGKGITESEDILIDAHSGQIIAELSHDYSLAPIQVYSAQKLGKRITPNLESDPITGKKAIKNCMLEDIRDKTSKNIDTESCKSIYEGESSMARIQCQVIDGIRGFPISVHPKSCTQVVNQSTLIDQSDGASLRAASNSKKVLNYYYTRFSRNSFDNQGSDLVSVIHAGEHMTNAFWNTDLNMMVYGDGDGITMSDLTQSVDVAGHEMTHGVTSKTAKLIMMGESGALNEAFSDFFGKLIEDENSWVMGDRLFLGSHGPHGAAGIRDLENPAHLTDKIRDQDGMPIEKPYPAHIKEQAKVAFDAPCNRSNDRCWVHFNSTIPSHASYLVYQRLGAKKAELLYYTALTQNLTSTETFKSAAQAILNTCSQLNYSSSDCSSVRAAYEEVGILSS